MIITPHLPLTPSYSAAPRIASGDRFTPSEPSNPVPTRQDMMRKLLQGDQPLQELRVEWQQKVGGRLLASPGVGPDGSLAFVNDDRLVVLRPDGTEQMSVPQGGHDWFNIFRAPVVHGGGVVAAGSSGLTSLRPDGSLHWHQDIGEVKTRPAVARDGTVFAAAGDALHAFSPDGEKLWSTSLRQELVEVYRQERTDWANGLERDLAKNPDVFGPMLASARKELAAPDFCQSLEVKFEGGPSLGPDGKLYCFTQAGPLFCLDQQTGALEWLNSDKRNYLAEGGLTPTSDGELLGVTGNSLLRVLGPQGKVRFDYGSFVEQRLDRMPDQQADEARRSGNMASSGLPALSPDGQTIYWAGRDGKLRAVDRQGNKRFTVEVPSRDGYTGEMDVRVGQDGTLYCANSKGLTALSPQGEQLWRYDTNDKHCFTALSGDKAILSTYSGEVFSLDCGALNRRAAKLADAPDPTPGIAVANGWVTIGGVRVKQR